jgi:hypothetical protein
MWENLFKYLQWLLYGLMGISALLGLLFYMNIIGEDTILYWTYFLIVLLILSTVGVLIWGITLNPKKSLRSLIFVGAAVLIAIIAYVISTNEFTPQQLEKMNNATPFTSKWVGAGLYILYLLIFAAVGSFIYAALSIFRK